VADTARIHHEDPDLDVAEFLAQAMPQTEDWKDAYESASPATRRAALERAELMVNQMALEELLGIKKDAPLPSVGELMEKTGLPATQRTTGTDIEPYDQRRVINECRFYMGQSAEAMLQAGERLIQLKEHEPHGEFVRIVENDLGLPIRTAQRMMASSLKFQTPQLASKAPTLAPLGKSKLFELLTEDDDELAALAEGGTLAGLTLDDVERMSVRELRQALREAKAKNEEESAELKATLEAARKVSKDRQDRIDSLEEQLEIKKSKAPTPEMLGYKAQMDLSAFTLKVVNEIKAEGLRLGGNVLKADGPEPGEQATAAVALSLGQIVAAVRETSSRLGVLPAENTPSVFATGAETPEWDKD
jgi:hypothetical protein